MMKLAYVTDLHGNRKAIETFLEYAKQQSVDAVIFGGDICPTDFAIKLPEFPDPTAHPREERRMCGGEILPFDMLHPDERTGTYTKSLEAIERLNADGRRTRLQAVLEQQGTIVMAVRDQFFDFESMLAEQRLLDKLRLFFMEGNQGVVEISTKFQESELEMVRDCVVDWLAKYEAGWAAERKANFIERCRPVLNPMHIQNFDQCAPSRFIVECLLASADMEPIRDLQVSFAALARGTDRFRKYIAKELEALRDRLIAARQYTTLIRETDISRLAEFSTISRLIESKTELSLTTSEQEEFLKRYFLPKLRAWKNGGNNIPIYLILGNDDPLAAAAMMDDAQDEGLLYFLGRGIHTLKNGFRIAGYSFVSKLPAKVEHRVWERPEERISEDLHAIQARGGNDPIIWVIHQPPFGILDQTQKGSVGSTAVLRHLEKFQPPIALFGHIHEGPRLHGSAAVYCGKTLCVNPGGEHAEGVRVAVIDTKTRHVDWRRL